MKKASTLLITGAMLVGSMTSMTTVSAMTNEEYIQHIFGEEAKLEDITENPTHELDKTEKGDFIVGEYIGRIIEDNKAEILKDGNLETIELSELKEMKDIQIYDVYDSPDIKRTSQILEKEIVLATYNDGNIIKRDSETKKLIEDASFSLYLSTQGDKWTKVATIKPTLTGKDREVKKIVKTNEYNVKEWITNYDRLSPEDKETYKDMPKEEPADKDDKKTEVELQAELDANIQTARKDASKWLLLEDEVKNGYLRTNEKWEGEVQNGKINTGKIELESKKIIGTEKDSVEVALNAEIDVELKATDSITGEAINGGKYDVYISYIEDPDDSRKVGEAKFVNGKLTGKYKINTSRKGHYESDEIEYVKEYGKLPTYARELYKDCARSRKEAKAKALKNAKEKAQKAQLGYENAQRVVRFVEKSNPEGYTGVGTFTIPVKKGKATKDLAYMGASSLVIMVHDMTGNDVSGANIKVESIKGNHLMRNFTTRGRKEEVMGTIAGAGYRITQVKPPKGYVKLKDSVKTVQSTISGESKETEIVELKATYQHKIEGTKVGVYNKKKEKVDEWITDSNPHFIENLVQGEEYTLKEIEAVPGYYRNEDIKFTVKDRDVVLTANSFKTTIIASNQLDGGEFTVTDKETGTVVDTWYKGKRELRGIEKGKTYIISQTKTPIGYVRARDYEITAVERNQELEIKNSRVKFILSDTNGNPIQGSLITILDQEGNIIESTVSTTEAYHATKLQAGREYVIQIEKPAMGFLKAKEWHLKIADNGEDYSHTFVSEIQRVLHEDDDKDAIKGSVMEVVDKDNNIVDTWTSGQHVIDLNQAQKKQLKQKGSLSLNSDQIQRSIQSNTREYALEQLEKGAKDSLPTIFKTKPEESAYAPASYLSMALEKLSLSKEEQDKKLEEIQKKISTLKGMTDLEKGNKLLEGLKADLNNLMDSQTSTMDEIESATITKEEKGKDEEPVYHLDMKTAEGIHRYYDIDLDGYETTHRISGMEEGNEYTLRIGKLASAYTGTQDIALSAEAKEDSTTKMVSERKVKPVDTDSFYIKPRTLIWMALAMVMGMVCAIYYKLSKRKVE